MPNVLKELYLCNYYLFSKDEANRWGGKWIVRLRKGLASRCWENLILAMLGEQFMVGEEICGAVVSIRFAVVLLLLSKYRQIWKMFICFVRAGGHHISVESNGQ